MEDVGIKVAQSIYRFFHNEQNIETLKHLQALGLNCANERKSKIQAVAVCRKRPSCLQAQ